MSPEQTKRDLDLLLDAFDDATEAGDTAQMASIMERLRPAFSAYQGACAAAGVAVDAQAVADCRAASEALRSGGLPPVPVRPPAPPRPAARPVYDDDIDLGALEGGERVGYGLAEEPEPAPVRRAPAVRRPAPVRPAPQEDPAYDEEGLGYDDEDDVPSPARTEGSLVDALVAFTSDRRKLFLVAAAFALLVMVFLYKPLVAVLLAAAIAVPMIARVRRTPAEGGKAPGRRRR